MNHPKKLTCLVLSLLLILSMSVTAFAAEGSSTGQTGTITVENPVAGQTYTAYKIFDVTYNGSAYAYSIRGDAPWYPDVKQWACPARLGVALDQQGKGLARRMLSAAIDLARQDGCDGVRFLVAKRNPIAQRSYAKLGFDICGEAEMWGEQWLCYHKRLAP